MNSSKTGTEQKPETDVARRSRRLGLLLATVAVVVQGAVFGIDAWAVEGNDGGCDEDVLSLACGTGAHAFSGVGVATAVGTYSDAYGANSSAFGASAEAADQSTAAGRYATAAGSNSVAVGYAASAGGFDREGPVHNNGNTAIGRGAQAGSIAAGQFNATAIGYNAHANAANAMALGTGSEANFSGSIAIGQDVATSRADQVRIGAGSNTYTLSGINSQASKDVQGGTRYLVTSDGAGNLATASVNMDDIEGLVDDVAEHTTQIASLNTTAGTHTTQIADHETRITSNTNTLNLHTTQISSLDSRTTVNETNIASLDGRVTSLETGLSDLGGELAETRREARQGIAAAIAMSNAPMPSAPGRTSWTTNVGHFKGATAFGGSLTHRLDLFDDPFAVSLDYSYGGGDSHALRFGLQGEF